ncbi:MAG: hypothetical protein ACXWH0_14235, partial [Acidimicrobiia bacterium]
MQSTAPNSHSLVERVAPGTIRWRPILVFASLTLGMILTLVLPALAEGPGIAAMLIGYGTAGFTLLRKTMRMKGRERLSWTLVGTGFILATTGILAVSTVQAVSGSVPAFGPTDLFFIAAYTFILAGLAVLPQLPSSKIERIRVYLDSLIGALSVAAVMWVLVLGDLIHEFSSATNWDRWAGSAYPIL